MDEISALIDFKTGRFQSGWQWKALGVERDNLHPGELKKEYRRLALVVHPDKNEKEQERAKRAFQILTEAFEYCTAQSGSSRGCVRRGKRGRSQEGTQGGEEKGADGGCKPKAGRWAHDLFDEHEDFFTAPTWNLGSHFSKGDEL
eukprot:TRINITY_DN29063_c0_g1_i1.p1 TRINITY_DN29063_c0_g1~~TRINITY_DN29063_c0_g1_i1.p1  ORF type:complete len:145 (-),score=35.01 TRINITY_DN29063_c0_g1_i1:231-665(-)